jgi:alkylation response protein AidB-like acyl-CoA dehydrogenase
VNAPLTWDQSARALAAEFAGRAADADGSCPFENFDQLHQAGLLTLAAPQALGGQGATLAQLGRVIGALGYACPATALVLTMQYMQHRSMGRTPPARSWPEPLARRLVHEASQGVSLINALRVEPELGSPARGGLPATVARRTTEGWRLSGHKIYSTGSPILRWYSVWARTDEAVPRVGNFLVAAGLPGTRIVPTWDHLGLRASGSHDVVFDDVLIPLEHAVDVRAPADWSGGEPWLQVEMAVMLGALYTGVARAARDWLVRFLHDRKPASLGAPLASLPRAQEALGAIEALLLTNERLVASLARDADEGNPWSAPQSGLVKSITTHNAVQAVEQALALTSNHGLARKNPLERHLRDALCGRIHTPQDDSARVAAGRAALGL